MQCVLSGEPASLLAARYILYRYPALLLDAYGEGPYMGQNLLHMCVVKQQREVRRPRGANRHAPHPSAFLASACCPTSYASCCSSWIATCTAAYSTCAIWQGSR